MVTGLETTRVLILMYHEAADRVWEHAVLSKHVRQCNVFLVGKNNTCRHYAFASAVSNMRMTADAGAADADWTRDGSCVDIDVPRGS